VIRILICAASPVTLAGLESVIRDAGDMEVVARQYDLEAALRDAERVHPDVVVMDLGAETDHATGLLNAAASGDRFPALVVLTDSIERSAYTDLLRAGVRALVPRDVAAEEMRAAIRAAANNLVTVHADLAAQALLPVLTARVLDTVSTPLTARERDVLQMMADGLGNKSIAGRLRISTHTVKFHVGSIMSKLHATSRTEAVTLGIRQGLILL